MNQYVPCNIQNMNKSQSIQLFVSPVASIVPSHSIIDASVSIIMHGNHMSHYPPARTTLCCVDQTFIVDIDVSYILLQHIEFKVTFTSGYELCGTVTE